MFVSYPSHDNANNTKRTLYRPFVPAFFFLCVLALAFSTSCAPAHIQRKDPRKTTPNTTNPPPLQAKLFCQQCPPPTLACKAPWLRLKQHTQQFLQTPSPTPQRLKRWKQLLRQVASSSACLSRQALSSYRHLLEVESDQDRNRFPSFPTPLSTKIVHTIVKLDLLRRAPHLAQRTSHNTKKPVFSPILSSDIIQAKGDASESDSRPPLVFTEHDLERFREPTTFLRWPARGAISSGFGLRSDPFHRKRRFHQGIDIVAPFGSPVYAASEGVVRHTGWMGSCGMGIMIQHRRGFRTLYCHLSQILTSPQDTVASGQFIGRIGSTGRSTGPHLHFGLFLHKHPINPRPYLPRKRP